MKARALLFQSMLSFHDPSWDPRTELSYSVRTPVALIRMYLAASNKTLI